MKRNRVKLLRVFGVAICVIGAIAYGFWYVWSWEYADRNLEIDFLSLARGHGVFIRLPDKEVVLIDAGQAGDIVRELTGLLPVYRRTIAAVYITSPDPKYVGGLMDLLDRYSIGSLYVPRGMATTTASVVALALAAERHVSVREISAGDTLDLETTPDDAQVNSVEKGNLPDPPMLKMLFPDPDFKFSHASPPLLVIGLIYGKVKFVLDGPATPSIQNFLAKEFMATSSTMKSFMGGDSRVDLLEYAGSGGASSVAEKFIESLAPKTIVVKSDGLPPKPPSSKSSKKPTKPPFTVHSYPSAIVDVGNASARFFSDGTKIWQ